MVPSTAGPGYTSALVAATGHACTILDAFTERQSRTRYQLMCCTTGSPSSMRSRGANQLSSWRITPPKNSVIFGLEEVVEIDEVALVEGEAQTPITDRERPKGIELVVEYSRPFRPKESEVTVLVLRPHRRAIARPAFCQVPT